MSSTTISETDLDAFIHQLCTGTDDSPAPAQMSVLRAGEPAPRLDLLVDPPVASPPRSGALPFSAPSAARRLFAPAAPAAGPLSAPSGGVARDATCGPVASAEGGQTVAELFRELTQPPVG